MSLSRGEINPLSLLGLRRLEFIPEHFSKIYVSGDVDIKLLDHWINYYLNSRYAFSSTIRVNDDNKIVDTIEIGIEDPREITMLTLGCPYIYDKKET
jgi:hypothetical protein